MKWFLFALGLVLGVVFASVGFALCTDCSFWNFRFIEILSLLNTIVVAGVVSKVVTRNLNFHLKRAELALSVVREFEEGITAAYALGQEYIGGKRSNAQPLVMKIKAASADLALVRDLQASGVLTREHKIEAPFWGFKASLTDSPFGSKRRYTPAEIARVENAYRLLRMRLHKLKVSAYVAKD